VGQMFIGSSKKKNTLNQMLLPLALYREESESEEELEWRLLRAGDLDRGLAPPLLAGLLLLLLLPPDLLLLLGGDLLLGLGDLLLPPWYPLLGGLLPPRWGDRLLPPLLLLLLLLGGDLLLADLGINTGAAEISCPSICPPSMCFIALSASACVLYSM